MKNRHIALMGILILSLILISGGFAAGYLAIQSFFELPKEIEDYISAVKEEGLPGIYKGSSREENSTEVSGTNVFLYSSFVRLDLYIVLNKEGGAEKVVIGRLDAAEGAASLITMPLDTRISLSDSLYQMLTAEYPAMPQLFQLEVLPSYVGKEKIGGVLEDIFHDMLFCDFDGIWVLEEEQVSSWMDLSQNPVALTKEVEEYLNLSPVQKQALQKLRAFEAVLLEGSLTKLGKYSTSLDTYAETVAEMKASFVSAELISGRQEAEGYQMDAPQAARRLSSIAN